MHKDNPFYVNESKNHPAKMNNYLCGKIIETFSKEGDIILDPMVGIGTTVVEGMLRGRNVVGVDIEEDFVEICKKNIELVKKQSLLFGKEKGKGTVILGNAKRLPLETGSIDCIVTSPPYESSTAFTNIEFALSEGKISDPFEGMYSTSKENIGNLGGKEFNIALRKIFVECSRVLKDDGKVVLVTRNFIKNRKVVRFDERIVHLARGRFELFDRYYRKINYPSFWREVYKKKHGLIVEYEDVLCFKKTGGVK